MKGLGEVVGTADTQCAVPIIAHGECCHGDDRKLRAIRPEANALGSLLTVQKRHGKVQQHDVYLAGIENLQHFQPVTCRNISIAGDP